MKTNRPGSTLPTRVGRLVAVGAALGAVAAPVWAGGPAGASQAKIKVSTMMTAGHGTVLDSEGKVVYTLKPSSTPCTSACLHVWPAVMLASSQKKPLAGHGVKASELGSVSVSGGRQATYKGHKLYWYSGDTPGSVNGNFTDQWGTWADVATVAPTHASSSTPTTSAPSGGASF
jgi:predicted lipoprotein with Yx(FWY)xxD motif